MLEDVQVIDSGMGNIASVLNMLKRVGVEASLISEPQHISMNSTVILPGVGAFDAGMAALRERGLDVAVRAVAARGACVLGICLGMHLLFDQSEEGESPGLGLIPGRVERFNLEDKSLKIPHMGWNVVYPVRDSSLFSSGDEEERFYFVHSYHVVCDDPGDVTAVAHHGYDFTCAVQRGRIMGVQFHPEKSHRFGMTLMKKLVEL